MENNSTAAGISAAGTVCWRLSGLTDSQAGNQEDTLEVMVVHRPEYGDISFPKGKAESGETLAQTAFRETQEETGLTVRLGSRIGITTYRVADGEEKHVHYWSAQVLEEADFHPNDEVERLEWLRPAELKEKLSYASDQHIAEKFLSEYAAKHIVTKTIILLRHAHPQPAGLERSLSAYGHAQAQALPAQLAPWQPEKIYCSPSLRCQQTAAHLHEQGIPLETDNTLGESYPIHLPRHILTRPERSLVVCSHAPGLSYVLTALQTDNRSLNPAEYAVLTIDANGCIRREHQE